MCITQWNQEKVRTPASAKVAVTHSAREVDVALGAARGGPASSVAFAETATGS